MVLPTLPPITHLNSPQQTKDGFLETVNTLFESAPPLAKKLFEARPYSSYLDLIQFAEDCIQSFSREDKLLVINAHPRIGTKMPLSAMSYIEQGCDREETQRVQEMEQVYTELAKLNEAYEKKFGFKFIVFVNGRSKAEIIPVLKKRLNGSSQANQVEIDKELALGLTEMMAIARDRLKKLSSDASL